MGLYDVEPFGLFGSFGLPILGIYTKQTRMHSHTAVRE